jgi:hypothetical protein
MSKDGLVRLPRISESLRDEFRDDVEDRFGTVRGHYRSEVEKALREYLNGSHGGDTDDRLRRLENAVERIDERTAALHADESGKNKKDSDVSPTTQNRIESIRDRVERESGTGPVHEAVVRQAIEDVAGHSDPTIRRYMQMLTDREILYPHPNRDTKFVYGEEEYACMIQSMAESGAITESEYWDVVTGMGGENDFRNILERAGYDDGGDDKPAGRTFQ